MIAITTLNLLPLVFSGCLIQIQSNQLRFILQNMPRPKWSNQLEHCLVISEYIDTGSKPVCFFFLQYFEQLTNNEVCRPIDSSGMRRYVQGRS